MASYGEVPGVNFYDELDDDTAQAILEAQIADLADTAASKSGDSAEDGDAALAATLLKQNLQELCDRISDRRMTQSIARAVIQDGASLSNFLQEETVAQQDREMASRLENGGDAEVAASSDSRTDIDDETLSKLAGLHIGERAGRSIMPNALLQQETENSGQGAVFPRTKRHTCIVCDETVSYFEIFTAPCAHDYCGDCIRQLFEQSLTDESLFPPRCCRQVIPIDAGSIALFLSRGLQEKYELRRVELETTDRTYCSDATCSTFILPTTINDNVAECPKCQTRTCAGCKKHVHAGPCQADADAQLTATLATQEGWQKCSNCERWVELNHGCYHITCLCRHEFCYLCGEVWKRCACDQWDPERLLARANQVVVRNNPQVQDAQVLIQMVNREAARLEVDHDCNHTRGWRSVGGRHECEMCFHTLARFILRCRQCNLQVCVRCKNNRL